LLSLGYGPAALDAVNASYVLRAGCTLPSGSGEKQALGAHHRRMAAQTLWDAHPSEVEAPPMTFGFALQSIEEEAEFDGALESESWRS